MGKITQRHLLTADYQYSLLLRAGAQFHDRRDEGHGRTAVPFQMDDGGPLTGSVAP